MSLILISLLFLFLFKKFHHNISYEYPQALLVMVFVFNKLTAKPSFIFVLIYFLLLEMAKDLLSVCYFLGFQY